MRKRALLGVLALVAVAGGAAFAIAWRPAIARVPVPPPASFARDIVARGAQLALIGNCVTCHSAPNRPAYAGGAPIKTPYGSIYASNITPDAGTGIGGWSGAAFRRAMREGVARDGSHLYPAFPYDHFTRMADADLDALYAFLMTRAPVRAKVPAGTLRFPFNLRPLLAGWNLLFLDTSAFHADPSRGATWNRGAYLAGGVAHCGACHTPRNAFQAEERGKAYAGGEAEGWQAPALDASSPAPVPWTADQIEQYLRTGLASEHGAANGPMQAVSLNLSQVDPADVRAIAEYTASLSGTPSPARREAAERARAIAAGTEPAPVPLSGEGAALYAGACAVCHQDGWRPGVAAQPPLALSTALASDDPTNAIRIVLAGRQPPEGEAGPQMPAFASMLNDAQIAAVLEWLRQAFAGRPEWKDLEIYVHRLRAPPEDP